MDSFNLVTEPWIKVLESKTNSERLVSIEELLKNAKDYRQIAGEMHGQDLAVLRLLEAILTTIYSRVNEDGQAYEWLKLDERMQVVGSNIDEAEFDSEELLNTWEALSSKVDSQMQFLTILIEMLICLTFLDHIRFIR